MIYTSVCLCVSAMHVIYNFHSVLLCVFISLFKLNMQIILNLFQRRVLQELSVLLD